MSKLQIVNLTNQAVRRAKTEHEALNVDYYKWEYGHLANSFSRGDIEDINVTADHLLFIYLSAMAKNIEGIWKVCIPTEELANDLDMSKQNINRSIEKLIVQSLIVDTNEKKNRHRVFTIPRPYNYKSDYIVPIILAVTKSIPLSLKLFILKLQLIMPSNKSSIYEFSSVRDLRKIVNNHESVMNNLSILDEKGLIHVDKNNTKKIDLKEVYHYLHNEYITDTVRKKNLV